MGAGAGMFVPVGRSVTVVPGAVVVVVVVWVEVTVTVVVAVTRVLIVVGALVTVMPVGQPGTEMTVLDGQGVCTVTG